jgi:hypothetical protein
MKKLVKAILPYGGTSGWSGTNTSRERAVNEDTQGITFKRQNITLQDLFESGSHGITWNELAAINDWHHGQASGVLSVLHKAKKIVRLEEKRNKCAVYVLPEYVFERKISERKVKTCRNCGHEL